MVGGIPAKIRRGVKRKPPPDTEQPGKKTNETAQTHKKKDIDAHMGNRQVNVHPATLFELLRVSSFLRQQSNLDEQVPSHNL